MAIIRDEDIDWEGTKALSEQSQDDLVVDGQKFTPFKKQEAPKPDIGIMASGLDPSAIMGVARDAIPLVGQVAASVLMGSSKNPLVRGGASLAVGGIEGINQAAKRLAEGDTLKNSMYEGLKTGAMTAATDFALGMGGKVLGEAVAHYGKPIMESKKAVETITGLKETMQDISEGTKRAILDLQKKASQLKERAEKSAILNTLAAKNEASVEIRNISKAIDETKRNSDLRLVRMIEPITNAMKNVGSKLSKDYDSILKSPVGKEKYVNVNDEIASLGDALGIPSTSGGGIKAQLSSIVTALKDLPISSNSGKKVPQGLEKRILGLADSGALDVRDTHWIKMALNEWASGLDKGTDYQLKNALRSTASSMGDKLDETLGGAYKAVSNKYREFINLRDNTDDVFGNVKNRPGLGIERPKIINLDKEIKDAIKSGHPIDSEYTRRAYNKVNNLYATADNLRGHGITAQADEIEGGLKKLVDSQFKMDGLNKELDDLNKFLKSNPATAQVIKLQSKTDRNQIAAQIKEMRINRERQLTQMSGEQREAAKKIIRKEDATQVAQSMIADAFVGLGGFTGTPSNAIKAIGSLGKLKYYGIVGAEAADRVLKTIEKNLLARTASKTVQASISNLVGNAIGGGAKFIGTAPDGLPMYEMQKEVVTPNGPF